jgi:hypothetical protein
MPLKPRIFGIAANGRRRQFNLERPGRCGLLSYGPDFADSFRRAASYVDRILRGAKPADLPVQSPVKFEMALNMQTAKGLGLEIPPNLLALADEVIEDGGSSLLGSAQASSSIRSTRMPGGRALEGDADRRPIDTNDTVPRRRFLHLAPGAAALPAASRLTEEAP